MSNSMAFLRQISGRTEASDALLANEAAETSGNYSAYISGQLSNMFSTQQQPVHSGQDLDKTSAAVQPLSAADGSVNSTPGELASALFVSASSNHGYPSPVLDGAAPSAAPAPVPAAVEDVEVAAVTVAAAAATAAPTAPPPSLSPPPDSAGEPLSPPPKRSIHGSAREVLAEKGGGVGCFRLYLQLARLLSTYILLSGVVLFCSQWMSLTVNMTPLGSYQATGPRHVITSPFALSLALPVLWLIGALIVAAYYRLVCDALRREFMAYVRHIVLPTILCLPTALLANALHKATRCNAAAPPLWPIVFEHGPFGISAKPCRASMVVHAVPQLALDLTFALALHAFPVVAAFALTAPGFDVQQDTFEESRSAAHLHITSYFGNLFMWLLLAHKVLILAVAGHELLLLSIDACFEVSATRARWSAWYRERQGLKRGTMPCSLDAICSCLCFSTRAERVHYEVPVVYLQGQLCYEPCTKLPCGAACFRCSRSFHQCKKTFWRCCCRIPCIIVFVIFIIALSLIASGFLANPPSAHTELATLVRNTRTWLPQWGGLVLGVLSTAALLRTLAWFRCLQHPRVVASTYTLFALISIGAMFLTQMSIARTPLPPATNSSCFYGPYLTPTEPVPEAARYAICDQKWFGLSISELSVIASGLAYLPPSDLLVDVTAQFFPGWEYVGGSSFGSQPMWQEFYNNQTNQSIISIMGTSSWGDLYYDLQLWVSTFWVEFVLTPLLPFFSFQSGGVSTSLYHEATSGTPVPGVYLDISDGVHEYLAPLLHYANYSARGDVMLAGHSLGAGLAKAVAAILGLEAVAFEGPGVVKPFIGMFYNRPWGNEAAFDGNVNVRANGDVVGWMGEDIGYTQSVSCTGFPTIPFISCHLSIASVILHNCAWGGVDKWARLANQTVATAVPLAYCPGLPDTLPTPLPDGIRLVETPRNLYRGG